MDHENRIKILEWQIRTVAAIAVVALALLIFG
jgi:hypothetical protein